MYLSLADRPHRSSRRGTTGRPRVGRVVLVLGTVSLLTDVSSESVAAILPLYLTQVVGLSALAYGFVDGLHQGVSALVRLGGGWLADRTDRPKWVAFAGYALSAVARVFLLFASSAPGIAAVVAADRVGKGVRTAPRDAMIASASAPEHLGRAFGVHRMLDTVGAATGPLLAFGILLLLPGSYSTVLVVSLAFAVVGVALLGLLVPDQRTRRSRAAALPPLRLADLADRRLRPLLAVAAALGLLTIGDGFIYLSLLEHGGFSAAWFPMLYVGTNVAYLALAVPLGGLADRLGRARVLVLGHVALVAAYLCAGLGNGLGDRLGGGVVATVATLVLLGVFYAATDGVIAALASRLVPEQARSTGIAAAQTVVALSRMAASFGFGFLWLAIGPRGALLLVAALLAAAVAGAWTQVSRLDARGGRE